MELISTPQTLTNSWADLGAVIDMGNFNGLSLFFALDINNSENLQIRAVYKRSLNDQEDYLPTTQALDSGTVVLNPKVLELGVDTDGNYSVKIPTNNTTPYIQLQVQVLTVGGTAGEILSAEYFTSAYPDFSGGGGIGGGGGGSSLALEVNGTPNADQTLLNLTEGSGITITDNGSGEVEIAASGGGGGEFIIDFKHFWPSNLNTATDESYTVEEVNSTSIGTFTESLHGETLIDGARYGVSAGGAGLVSWNDYIHELLGLVGITLTTSEVSTQFLWGYTSAKISDFLSTNQINFSIIPDSAFFLAEYDTDGYYLIAVTIDDTGTEERTTISSLSTGSTAYRYLKIKLSSTSVEFYVNGTLVATHTTNIPTGNFAIPVRYITTLLCQDNETDNSTLRFGPMTDKVTKP